jgi:hypothetical protein
MKGKLMEIEITIKMTEEEYAEYKEFRDGKYIKKEKVDNILNYLYLYEFKPADNIQALDTNYEGGLKTITECFRKQDMEVAIRTVEDTACIGYGRDTKYNSLERALYALKLIKQYQINVPILDACKTIDEYKKAVGDCDIRMTQDEFDMLKQELWA